EAKRQACPRAVVDELEDVIVLVALLVLVKIRELVAGLDAEHVRERVRHRETGVRVALPRVNRPALRAKTVDLGKEAAGHRSAQAEPRGKTTYVLSHNTQHSK